jgi:hypothetical protein
LFDKRGFSGVDAPGRTVRRSSWLLLAIAAAATAVSLAFVGNRVFSSFLPFIAVFAAHGIIKARLRPLR